MLRLPLPVLIAAGVVLIPANLIASAELAHTWGRRAAVVVDTPDPPENVGFIGHHLRGLEGDHTLAEVEP